MELLTKMRKWLADLLPATPARGDAAEQNQIHDWMQNMAQRRQRYVQMTTEELKALPDHELVTAVQERAERHVDSFGMEHVEQRAGYLDLSEPQRTAYTLYWYESEVCNGGLCQFFVNSSRMVAPYVSRALSAVGAEEHQKLFDDFVSEHEIDLDDLSSFAGEDEETFEAQYDRYTFEAFDNAFYEMEPLERYVIDYLKAHMDEV